MVSWDIVCRPIKAGGLGILNRHNMSTALLTKWVARPPDLGEGSPLCHPHVLHVDFSDACRGAAAPRECHAECFLAWDRPWQGRCPCGLELGVPAFC